MLALPVRILGTLGERCQASNTRGVVNHPLIKLGRTGEPNMPEQHRQRNSSWDRIIRDPGICGGEPVFKGTRVTLKTVLASLADGDSIDDLLAGFPTLKREDVQAAISFAAASAEEDLPVSAVPDI